MSLWYPCVYCTEDLKCTKYSDDEATSYCLLGPCHDETKSNADRIRAMSDEELAEYLSDIAGWLSEYEGKAHDLLKWIKAPADKEG